MSKTKIKPILHWEPRGYGLFWDRLCLVMLEKTERNGKPYYKLDHPDPVFNLFPRDFADVEKVWEDEEIEELFDLYMEDNGKVHDRLKEIYEQIIGDMPYEVLTSESIPEFNYSGSQLPELQSETPFADKFFRVPRRVTYFTLGIAPQEIFERFHALDLNGDECCCFLDATGIEIQNKTWRIGIFSEPVIVCGQVYPKHTVAILQGMKPNSRIALFSMDETDGDEMECFLNDNDDSPTVDNDQSATIDQQQTHPDELNELQASTELRKKLKEFVSRANPIPDNGYERHPLYRIWNEYMVSAAKSHDRAKQALKLQDDCTAWWNAVHAMAAYSAAFVVLEHEDEQIARADAIFACFDTLRCVREEYPELDGAFGKRPLEE